jgi:hypothetical protein
MLSVFLNDALIEKQGKRETEREKCVFHKDKVLNDREKKDWDKK